MTGSAKLIDADQDRWAGDRPRDARLRSYLPLYQDNLFLGRLHDRTFEEFTVGDGSELKDTARRPAKMRALASSSALAVNFFDAWRDADKAALSEALGTPVPISAIEFECKTRKYPVRPRSPNLDLLLHLENGQYIGVESKFSEPYRSDDGHGILSARYFAGTRSLWSVEGLHGAAGLAARMAPEWKRLDAPQLVKHMLGLACDPRKPKTLLYIWFDTQAPDAGAHERELHAFGTAVAGDAVAFSAITYQAILRLLAPISEPVHGWREYMEARYFPRKPAV